MRVRMRAIAYSFGGATPGLERHYRELREAMLRQVQHYGLHQPSGHWRPPIDIHETSEAILLKMEIAGLDDEHLELTLYDNALVISGQREDDDHEGETCYHEAQVRYGPFRAEVALATPINREAVEATYRGGFLRVRLPKVVPSDPRTTSGTHHRAGTSAGDVAVQAAPVAVPLAHSDEQTPRAATAASRGEM